MDTTQNTSSTNTAPRRHWWLLFGTAALIIISDQLSKLYIIHRLDHRESWAPIKFLEPVIQFTHVHNTGAAFGMFPDSGFVFLGIALVVTGIIVVYYSQLPPGNWLIRLALGLQLGGAIGNNMIDRVRLGYVVDFLDVEFWPLAEWPVFNIADSSIVVGVLLLAFEMIREERRLAKATKAEESLDGDSSAESSEEKALYG
ncbi:MAG: signal peptidase II [Chloroflexi bacterium]|nr:signal peptidase II [Chloroflexota bacterium]